MASPSSLPPASIASKAAKLSISSFLVPFLNQPRRHASILSSLSDRPGAYNKRIRVGRGPASGKGKTSGRGHKGQKQKGKVPKNFTGGQTSEDVVHGHYGFKNVHAVEMTPVNLDRIQDWINQGRIDPAKPITLKELCATRAIHGIKDGVKLLGRGSSLLTTSINIVVSRASMSAINAIEALGGTVTTRYYTKFAIRRIRQGKIDPYVSMKWEPSALPLPVGMGSDPVQRVKGNGFQYRLPDPTSRKDLEYYRDPAKRGYLSHTLKEGEFPSLFFKPPVSDTFRKEKVGAAKKARSENRLW